MKLDKNAKAYQEQLACDLESQVLVALIMSDAPHDVQYTWSSDVPRRLLDIVRRTIPSRIKACDLDCRLICKDLLQEQSELSGAPTPDAFSCAQSQRRPRQVESPVSARSRDHDVDLASPPARSARPSLKSPEDQRARASVAQLEHELKIAELERQLASARASASAPVAAAPAPVAAAPAPVAAAREAAWPSFHHHPPHPHPQPYQHQPPPSYYPLDHYVPPQPPYPRDHHAPPSYFPRDHHAPPSYYPRDHHAPPSHHPLDQHAPPSYYPHDHHAPPQPPYPLDHHVPPQPPYPRGQHAPPPSFYPPPRYPRYW